MQYAVFADISRPLTEQEQSAVFQGLETCVPESGCAGHQKGPNDEVYFCVEALSEAEARMLARDYLAVVLLRAGLAVEYTLSLQTIHTV